MANLTDDQIKVLAQKLLDLGLVAGVKPIPAIVPCGTVPKAYYRQLSRLRNSSAFDRD